MEEKGKAPKSIKQKLRFFWDYYKWLVLIPVAALIFLVTFITSYLEENKTPAFAIAVINARDITSFEEAVTEEYVRERQINTEKTPVRIEGGILHPKVMDETASTDTITVAGMQKYTAMLTNSTIDVTVSPVWSVEEYEKADAYCDLQELLPEEIFKELEEDIFYCKDGKGEDIAVGVFIGESLLLGEFYEEADPVLTVSAYSTRKEEAVLFIEWLLKKENILTDR